MSAGLASIFGLASVSKLLTFDELAGVIAASDLLPRELARVGAVAVLAVEALTIALLLAPRTRRMGFAVAASILSVFGAYHGWRWHEGIGVPCTCFGPLFKIDAPTGLALCGALLLATQYGLNAPTPPTLNRP